MAQYKSSQLVAGQDPRPTPSFWQNIFYALTLRVYGNNLLTRAGRGYLWIMSFLMLVVAVVEGVSWGYFGTQMSDYPLLSGVGMGVFIFLFIWFFDRTLMTADYLQNEHAATLQGKTYLMPTSSSALGTISQWFNIHKVFIIRIVIAFSSLIIVAPYVSELAFYKEIQNKQQNYFLQAVSVVKQQQLAQKKHQIDQLATEIASLNRKYQDETSGKLSGIRGRGAAAKAIEQELNNLQPLYQQLRLAQQQYIERVERAVAQRDVAELASLDIKINQDSAILRKKAVADIKTEHPQEYWQVEITIRVLLVMLAFGLFSMKWLQPRAVKLYFSSQLQQEWSLYCLGKYDAILPSHQRRDWLLNSQDALPEEFERIIINCMSNVAAQTQQEAKQQQLANQRQHAQQMYFQRLAQQQAEIEKQQQERDFFEQNIRQRLDEIDQLEQNYLTQHGEVISQLKTQEQQLIDDLHQLEKEFKTQQERVKAREQRIVLGEREYQETQYLLQQTRQRPDNDTLEVLRTIADLENGLRSQQERVERQRAELLGFEANQQFFNENVSLLHKRLEFTQQQLMHLQQPLQALNHARAQIQQKRIECLLAQGLQESPFKAFSEQELPHLIQKLQLSLESA